MNAAQRLRRLRVPAAAAVCVVAALSMRMTVHACACCAERGTWYQASRRVTAEELAEIGRLNFGPEARTYVTAAGLEEIAGIKSPVEIYRLHRLDRPSRRWRLQFTDRETGRQSVLGFEIPERGTFLDVDLQDRSASPAPEVQLYKEWRLIGPVTASGAFTGGTFRLILQGRGNACPNADDFQSWILQITGPASNYSFFGRLDRPTPRLGAR